MQKVGAQHNHAQNQPAQRQGNGAALESPQSERIAQLEAVADASLQAGRLSQLAAMANRGPTAAAQRKFIGHVHSSPAMVAQRKVVGGIDGHVAAQRQETPAKPNNTGLPDNLKSGIESLSGISMDNVKVHYNSSQPAQLNALAYAQGTDIHVAPGQEQHLPHEAWHVVQQAQGRVQPTMQMKDGVPVNGDQGLEHEADVMGERAIQGQPVLRHAGSGSFAAQMMQPNKYGKVSGTESLAPVKNANGPVQGKFGFEIELGVALGWSDSPETDQDGSKYGSPDSHVTMPKAGSGDGFAVHVDHNADIKAVRNSASIVELVTEPALDEATVDKDGVIKHIKKLTDFVGSVDSKTSGLDGRAKLADITPVTATKQKEGTLFVGGEGKLGQQLNTGYMQSTFAVDLAAVPQVMRDQADPARNHNNASRNALDLAGAQTDHVTNKFLSDTEIFKLGWKKTEVKVEESGGDESAKTVKYISKWGAEFDSIKEAAENTKQELRPLMGLLSLMINYLRIGALVKKHPTNSLRKNHLGVFFYKTGLHNVRNTLTGASKFAVENDVIRSNLSSWLMQISGRSDEMFCDVQKAFEPENELAKVLSTTMVSVWIDGILDGTADTIFAASLNGYSKELGPEDVGKEDSRTKGVVLESRRMAPSSGYTYEKSGKEVSRDVAAEPDQDQNQRGIDDWENIAVGLWAYLRKVNGIDTD
ncbi:MAG TPA: DUF4157 domain-containing protein [Gallionella sp.]|nr:DUF4157 domain-containing protein [Gallionella sp.]